jgi:hypothetical protein
MQQAAARRRREDSEKVERVLTRRKGKEQLMGEVGVCVFLGLCSRLFFVRFFLLNPMSVN